MDLIKPAALKPGDTIGIVAPASNIKLDLLQQGCRELERLGFKTHFRPDITTSYRYLSGSHERRRAEFMEMLCSPAIHAVFCARGGYGSGHLIPDIDTNVLRQNAKIVCGASDITLLLNRIERARIVSFHGPMAATSICKGTGGYDRQVLLDLIVEKRAVRFPVEDTEVLRSGTAEGRLIGGGLSLAVSTLGTPHEIDTRDSILILEDIDARPYQIDRMLTHLKQAGKFRDVRGVVFGEMLNCVQHPNQGYRLQDVMIDV